MTSASAVQTQAVQTKAVQTRAIPTSDSRGNYRQSLCAYLGDLPLLDRQVLFQRYVLKEEVRKIATSLQITPAHVEHIIGKTDEYRRNIAGRPSTQAIPAASTWTVTSVPRHRHSDLNFTTAGTTRAFRPMPRPDMREYAA